MKIGTKSVLFGVHQFAIHPWFVAAAWAKLYGFPFDPRLWVAFFVHDLGYLGSPNMDGPEGEEHPRLGARIIHFFFDWPRTVPGASCIPGVMYAKRNTRWHDFVLYHSRHLALKYGQPFSRLCVADKLAPALTPWWLYLPCANLSGEINEYMARAKRSRGHQHINEQERHGLLSGDQRLWYAGLQSYMRRWVDEHKEGRADHWTERQNEAA
jgi:hypothetical protein